MLVTTEADMDPRPRTPPIVRRSSKAQASQPAPGTRQGALAGVVSLIARRAGAVEARGRSGWA